MTSETTVEVEREKLSSRIPLDVKMSASDKWKIMGELAKEGWTIKPYDYPPMREIYFSIFKDFETAEGSKEVATMTAITYSDLKDLPDVVQDSFKSVLRKNAEAMKEVYETIEWCFYGNKETN